MAGDVAANTPHGGNGLTRVLTRLPGGCDATHHRTGAVTMRVCKAHRELAERLIRELEALQ